jgi:hypothetical protein
MSTRGRPPKSVSRAQESRSMELRDNNLNPVMNMLYRDSLYFSPDEIPEGWNYRWIRVSLKGEPDNSRPVQMRRMGWTPVPADRYPERVFEDPWGRLNHMRNYIHHDGLVLYERPAHYAQQEQEYFNKLNHERVNSMPGIQNLMGESAIPFRNESKDLSPRNNLTKGASFGI